MSPNHEVFADYPQLLAEVKELIRQSQYQALKAVNTHLIQLYWQVGARIVERQQAEGWGKGVVEQLAEDIRNEFPGTAGFSARNIWNMRSFYLTYQGHPILQPLVAEIAWSHNLIIMEKCKDDQEREFYMKMARKFGWTKNVLALQIANRSYEKYLLNQTNFEKTLPEKYRNQAKLAVKDEYSFGFLELADKHAEHELEEALVSNIRKFLLEMGGYYTFLGNQYRIEVEGEEYFIDLLLYHRKLRCLVALELKVGEFKPEYAGKMQFYLSLLNDKVKLEEETPSIGIIICRTKKRLVVEYALKDSNQPIGVSSYTLQGELPQALQKLIPSPEEIQQKLQALDL